MGSPLITSATALIVGTIGIAVVAAILFRNLVLPVIYFIVPTALNGNKVDYINYSIDYKKHYVSEPTSESEDGPSQKLGVIFNVKPSSYPNYF